MATTQRNKSGTYTARERGRLPVSGRPYDLTATHKQKREALRALAALVQREVEADRLGFRPAAHRTLTEVAPEWLDYVRKHSSPRTHKTYEASMRLHLLPRLGRLALAAIRPGEVEAWADEQRRAGRSSNSIRSVVNTLSACLRWAERRDLVQAVPQFRRPGKVSRTTYLTLDEVDALVAAATRIEDRLIVLLGARAGLRVAEMCGLTWDRVDLSAGIIRVEVQATETGELAPCKHDSCGDVPTTRDLLAALREAKMAAEPGCPWVIGGAPRDASRPKHPGVVRHRLRRLGELAGLPAEKRYPHALRHTTGTSLVTAGVPARRIQAILRHRSITTTQVYAHVTDRSRDEAIDALDSLLARR